jgi:hypothetical protein
MDAELNRPTRAPADGAAALDPRSRVRRLATETKAAFKTTEFFAFLAVLVGLLLASYLVDGKAGGDDPFNAEQAWRYITFLTIGYMVSRGLAKAGSREPYDDHS